MTLKLYSAPKEGSYFSEDNPFTITFDGFIGGSQDKCIYIRNDDTSRWYTGIQLEAIYTGSDTDITDGSRDGWEWKMMEKDVAPHNMEWDSVSSGNTLSISSDIGSSTKGDIVTYLPVWIRITIPRGQNIQTIRDVFLRITGTESLV